MREASAAAAAAFALEAAEAAQGAEGAPAAQKQAEQPVVTTSLKATGSGRLALAIEPAVAFAAGDRSVLLGLFT